MWRKKKKEQDALDTLKQYLLDNNVTEIKVKMDDDSYKEFKEVKHGYWRDVCFGTGICSVCGRATMDVIKQTFKYCPKCGALLDEWVKML